MNTDSANGNESGAGSRDPARNGLVDYGRLISALGIVWFHTQAPGMRLAYAALPFFLVLLAMPSRARPAMRARRLLIPFLQWSAIYAGIHLIFALRRAEPPLGWWEWNMLLAGTAIHLWFLPFVFLVSLSAPLLRLPFMAPTAALATALMLGAFGTPQAIPWAQWSFGLIPVLIGFSRFTAGGRIAWATLALCWLILSAFRPSPDNSAILLGTGIALLTLSLKLAPTGISHRCASLSMWIYLAHPLAIIAGQTAGLAGTGLALFALPGAVLIAVGIAAGRKLSFGIRMPGAPGGGR